MLETRDLTKVYDNTILAVNKLNLKVNPGEIYVVLGANGAGKSTTISMLLNFIDPTNGTALVNDIEIPKFPLEAKKHLAYVSEMWNCIGISPLDKTWSSSPSWAVERRSLAKNWMKH